MWDTQVNVKKWLSGVNAEASRLMSVRRRQCKKCTISLKEINTNEKPPAGAGKGSLSNRPQGVNFRDSD